MTDIAEQSKPRDLKDYQCKDIMILSGEDREIAFALLHGYRLGKKNTTHFEAAVLAEATDNIWTIAWITTRIMH
jgi:hypothetical protein